MGLPAAIAAQPVLFAILFAIFVPLILWKWRSIGRSTEKAISDMTHGLRADADQSTARHDLGIGTKDIIVMRPNGVGGMIWFALLFFGGGAVFFLMVVLPSEPTSENWWTFTGLAVFAIGAMVAIEVNQTRIIVDATCLERRRVFHRREQIRFSEISSADLNPKAASPVLNIQTADGRSLKISAQYSGFLSLLHRLKSINPELSVYAHILRLKR